MKNQYKEQMKKPRHHRKTRDSCLEVLRATGLGLILMGRSAVEAAQVDEIKKSSRLAGKTVDLDSNIVDKRYQQTVQSPEFIDKNWSDSDSDELKVSSLGERYITIRLWDRD